MFRHVPSAWVLRWPWHNIQGAAKYRPYSSTVLEYVPRAIAGGFLSLPAYYSTATTLIAYHLCPAGGWCPTSNIIGQSDKSNLKGSTATTGSTRPPQEVPENRGGIFCMGAQTRTDILPYMSLIPVFGYFMRGTSIKRRSRDPRHYRG